MKIFLFIFFLLPSFRLYAGTFDAVMELASRRVPWLVVHLQFKKIPGVNKKDVFELPSHRDKIFIAASNVNSGAMGLNWYLQYFCHRSMSHMGDNLAPVYPLPEIEQKVRATSPFQYRYVRNYCTFNYTLGFYDWEDWQRELDGMALHEVNLMLVPIGTEAVWQKTMKKVGFSKAEIMSFIPGPAFNSWWLMSNLEGWDGPVTQRMIDRRTFLEKKFYLE